MSLIRYNNRMMNPGIINFLSDVLGEEVIENRYNAKTMVPAVNIKETEKDFEIELAVPGFDKKDISVEVEKDVLTISSEKEQTSNKEDKQVKRMEFSYDRFKRTFTIPEDADADKIKAKSENGVLVISLPKKEQMHTPKKMIKVA